MHREHQCSKEKTTYMCAKQTAVYVYLYNICYIYVSKMSILFDSHRCHPLSSVSDRKRHLTSSPSMNSGNLEICWGWSRWLNYCKTATTTTTTTTSYAHQTSQTHHKHITNTSQTHRSSVTDLYATSRHSISRNPSGSNTRRLFCSEECDVSCFALAMRQNICVALII